MLVNIKENEQHISTYERNTIHVNIVGSMHYCKRCYFCVTKFSRLAAQKHIRGLLNSR